MTTEYSILRHFFKIRRFSSFFVHLPFKFLSSLTDLLVKKDKKGCLNYKYVAYKMGEKIGEEETVFVLTSDHSIIPF